MLFPYIEIKFEIVLEFVCLLQDLFTFQMQCQNETDGADKRKIKKPGLTKLKHVKGK